MKASLFFLLFGTLITQCASAQSGNRSNQSADKDFYAGLGYGVASYEGDVVADKFLNPGQKLEDNTTNVDLYLGYHFTRNLSVEAGYTQFQKVSDAYLANAAFPTLVAVNTAESVEANAFTLNATYKFLAYNSVDLFGLLGYSRLDLDRTISGGLTANSGGLTNTGSTTEDSLVYGFGGKFHIDDNWSARLQWTRTSTSSIDLDTVRASLEVKF